MKRLFLFLIILGGLTACNSVYMKPNTLDANRAIYVRRGGYTMQRAIKETMEKRGYNVVVGRAKTIRDADDDSVGIDLDTTIIPNNAKYVVRVGEYEEDFRPVWCVFNGFWWWHFYVSISDQNSGQEILAWRGRGCANSSTRLLDKILDDLEIKAEDKAK